MLNYQKGIVGLITPPQTLPYSVHTMVDKPTTVGEPRHDTFLVPRIDENGGPL